MASHRRREPQTDTIRASRALCRRTDVFVPDVVETEIAYRSGSGEGILLLAANRLDSHALALAVALADAYARGQTVYVRSAERRFVAVVPQDLVRAIYGTASGELSRRLGLVRISRNGQPVNGALQALRETTIRIHSAWLEPDGQRGVATTDFSVVASYHWRTIGRRDLLLVEFGWPVEADIRAGALVSIPRLLLQRLGPRHGVALRVAVFVLSQAPMGRERVVAAETLTAVIRPGASRDPQRYPGRYMRYLRQIIQQIDRADPQHTWQVRSARKRQWNVTCAAREVEGTETGT